MRLRAEEEEGIQNAFKPSVSVVGYRPALPEQEQCAVHMPSNTCVLGGA